MIIDPIRAGRRTLYPSLALALCTRSEHVRVGEFLVLMSSTIYIYNMYIYIL